MTFSIFLIKPQYDESEAETIDIFPLWHFWLISFHFFFLSLYSHKEYSYIYIYNAQCVYFFPPSTYRGFMNRWLIIVTAWLHPVPVNGMVGFLCTCPIQRPDEIRDTRRHVLYLYWVNKGQIELYTSTYIYTE